MAKKPSVLLSVLSWTFTPSSVMLITPRGSPLICEFRLLPAVVTPGSIVTKSSAARLEFGSFMIWFALMVEEMTVDWVWTISDLDDTRICSSRPPTSSTARTLAGEPAVSTTSLVTKVLNPCSVTVTV